MAETLVAVRPALRLRAARAADNEQIAAIWNHEVTSATSTTDTEPRSARAQREWLAAHAGPYPVVVAVAGGEVLGYGSLSPYKSKPAFARTAEDSVYVRAGQRGRGIGALILADLVRLARGHGHRSVMARITTENHASRRLHERLGFRLVGVEQETAFKQGRWLDVAIMQLRL